MKSFLLIGLGKFGRTLGEKMMNMGAEVTIVDRSEDVVNSLSSLYTNAFILNCMNLEALKKLDVPSYDACIVAVCDDFQSSLEITSNLKDCNAKRVISRAATEIQSKFLMRVGADEVIFPDRDIAEKLAVRLNSTNVINYIDLDAEFSIFEIACPARWAKKKLSDINPRKKYGMNILTVKKGHGVIDSLDGEYVFEADDQLVIFGKTEKILKFSNKQK